MCSSSDTSRQVEAVNKDDHIERIFCQFGNCLLWAGFLKITQAAKIFGLPFTIEKVKRHFFQKWVNGQPVGRLFYKLIWSPCLP
jgi:hypothetical protein